MNESILTTTKKLLGIPEDYTHFDSDLVVFINSALNILTEMGVGDKEGFVITGSNELWTDYIPNYSKLSMIKEFVYLKVRLMFDPPQSNAFIEAINSRLDELTYRIYITADPDQLTFGDLT